VEPGKRVFCIEFAENFLLARPRVGHTGSIVCVFAQAAQSLAQLRNNTRDTAPLPFTPMFASAGAGAGPEAAIRSSKTCRSAAWTRTQDSNALLGLFPAMGGRGCPYKTYLAGGGKPRRETEAYGAARGCNSRSHNKGTGGLRAIWSCWGDCSRRCWRKSWCFRLWVYFYINRLAPVAPSTSRSPVPPLFLVALFLQLAWKAPSFCARKRQQGHP